jgi:hypothetical protein
MAKTAARNTSTVSVGKTGRADTELEYDRIESRYAVPKAVSPSAAAPPQASAPSEYLRRGVRTSAMK